MIIGAHSILYPKMPAADRAFLRDVLGFPSEEEGAGAAEDDGAHEEEGDATALSDTPLVD